MGMWKEQVQGCCRPRCGQMGVVMQVGMKLNCILWSSVCSLYFDACVLKISEMEGRKGGMEGERKGGREKSEKKEGKKPAISMNNLVAMLKVRAEETL